MAKLKAEINTKSSERVKLLCKRNQITQNELAEKIGVTPKTISAIVTGKTAMSAFIAHQIKQEYPIFRVEWLLGEDDAMTEDDYVFKKRMDAFFEDDMPLEYVASFLTNLGYTFAPCSGSDNLSKPFGLEYVLSDIAPPLEAKYLLLDHKGNTICKCSGVQQRAILNAIWKSTIQQIEAASILLSDDK